MSSLPRVFVILLLGVIGFLTASSCDNGDSDCDDDDNDGDDADDDTILSSDGSFEIMDIRDGLVGLLNGFGGGDNDDDD